MSVLPIRIYPDPVLRVRCRPVEVFDRELARLIADMVETMHAAPGIGLAANQVGVESRVAVVDLSSGERGEDLLVLINPEIFGEEGEDEDVEGCLSIPDFTEKVPRPIAVSVRAADASGRRFELEAEGLLARAICHELDHLEGRLFTDRLRGLRRERARRALRRLTRDLERAE
ncbi:MAG TPA: peptide deformylase [Thermoanaerobaculia bacterium]|nr:peptide deformylase [Thermoanaerobaculia bacterium]